MRKSFAFLTGPLILSFNHCMDAGSEVEVLRSGLEALKESSNTVNAWTLAVLAGSIAVLISSDYLRPSGRVRYLYLLFLPGWVFLALSLYHADRVFSGYGASVFSAKHEVLMEIGRNMNI